ncbi:zinc finger BED domain-containing protein 1-like [Rhizophagus clarus]|uniref:Zinc finger BED domain-containing protein 1-like n=1 Tax=Rhizophagus clarus TaxID=94130 RepID=A0A8H3QP40_9GLOM|nr:zinc finger BED domain-containing protein 1-like [Rhizophagus clarus]
MPAIAALIASIKPGAQDFRVNVADDLPDEEITILDSAEVTISDNENEVETEVVDLTAVTGRCRKKIDITEPIQTKDIIIPSAEHTNPTEHHSNRVRKSILDMIYASSNPADSSEEIDKYLEINEECKETNPLEWWKLHEKRFPTLTTITRKYLGICAISVLSERLFSDVGNNITNKRINLDPNLVEQMLFLKQNINVMGSIFPLI